MIRDDEVLEFVRGDAARVLELGSDAVPALIRFLHYKDTAVCYNTLWCLKELIAKTDKRTLLSYLAGLNAGLIRLLDHPDDGIQVRTVIAIGEIAKKTKAPALIDLLVDSMEKRHGLAVQVASWALEELGKPAVPGLLELVKKDKDFSESACRAIGDIGARIPLPEAIPVIVEYKRKQRGNLHSGIALSKIAKHTVAEFVRLQIVGDVNTREIAKNALSCVRMSSEQVRLALNDLKQELAQEKDVTKIREIRKRGVLLYESVLERTSHSEKLNLSGDLMPARITPPKGHSGAYRKVRRLAT